MPVTEQNLMHALHGQPVPTATLDVCALLAHARGRLHRRRARRVGTALALPLLLGAGVALDHHDSPYLLAASGLTLAAGSEGPTQISDNRVDLGDGIQAWRQGRNLYIGYPNRPYSELDTSSISSRWGDLGYDFVIFDDPGQNDGSTIVVGSVRGAPTSVTVTIQGASAPATIACFTQTKGWCSYKANVPTSINSYDDQVRVEIN